MNQFLLILLITLECTLGVQDLQKPIIPNADIDISDYILPDEFFPENDRDAISVFQHIPDVDVSQYALPDEFYPENDRDAFPIRRFLHRRPPVKIQPTTSELLHSGKMGRLEAVENDLPIYEWKMRMKKKNSRRMNPFGNSERIYDHHCPFQHLIR